MFVLNDKTEIGNITLNLDNLENDLFKPPKLKRTYEPKNIKSILSNNNDKAFICYINNNDNIACAIWFIWK